MEQKKNNNAEALRSKPRRRFFFGFFGQAWQDYLLGRLIRQHQISVMRLAQWWSEGDEWSSCDQRMSEDYSHNGKWGGGKTPLEAVKSILPPK